MGGAERVITGVLEGARGPDQRPHLRRRHALPPVRHRAKFGVYYYPIVSSSRAFNALWKRAYSKAATLLGGVVYEDPWLAGGHNGLSNGEDPDKPEDPFPRVLALRKLMRTFGLDQTPIIMAGGVWWLEEWEDWIDNPELGPIAFQFGTRPLLTQESPISHGWKQRLLTLKEGDVFLNRFSPTGFYSSAVNNGFIGNCASAASARSPIRPSRWASTWPTSAWARAAPGLPDAGRSGRVAEWVERGSPRRCARPTPR